MAKVPKSTATKAHQYYSRGARDLLIAHSQGISKDLEWVMMLGFYAGMRYREIVEAVPDWIVEAGDGYRIDIRPTADYGIK